MLYVLFWSFAGAASAAYLGVIISDPNLVNALSGPGKPSSPLERTNDELFATPQSNTLRDRLSDAQTEIAQLRNELNDRKQAYAEEQTVSDPAPVEQALDQAAPAGPEVAHNADAFANNAEASDRSVAEAPAYAAYEREPAPIVGVPGISVPGISLFEPHSPPAHGSSQPAPVSEVAIANAAIENGPAEPSSIETGAISVPPAPVPGLRPKPVPVVVVSEPKAVIDKQAPAAKSPIKVAPVKVVATPAAPASSATPPAQKVAFGPAAVTAAAKPAIGVRLATGQSLDALRVTWNAMRDRHPEALKGLAPRYVKQDALGSAPFSLVAGPVSKPTDVLEICADLGGEARECALATFTGKTL